MFGDWTYVLALVALFVAVASWRDGTTEFLAEFGRSSQFNYAWFLLDLHGDLAKAMYLSAVHRRFVPAVLGHAVSLVAMWVLVVTGPEWPK